MNQIEFSAKQIAKAKDLSARRHGGKILRTGEATVAKATFGPHNRFCAELFAGWSGIAVFIVDAESVDQLGCREVLWQGEPADVMTGVRAVMARPDVIEADRLSEQAFSEA